MSAHLWTTFISLVLCWCCARTSLGLPITTGLVRRGARLGAGLRQGDLLSGRDFLSVFIENQNTKQEDMDQSAEPSSMIGEVAKLSARRRTVQNNLGHQDRKPTISFDDPVFGSRQSPKYKFRYPYYTRNTRLGSVDKDRNDIYSDSRTSSQRNNSDSQLESDSSLEIKPLYGSEYKNYYGEGGTGYDEGATRTQSSVTPGVIALGESRSYSTSTNTQSPLQKEFEDNSISERASSTTESASTEEESLTTIVHSGGKPGAYSWASGTRWTPPKADDAEKIISVRVSSSVGTSAKIPGAFPSLKTSTQLATTEIPLEEFVTTSGPTLLTEEEPRVTAVQRSQFSVEEALPEATSSDSFNPQVSPVSYHSAVSSATSGSRVQFYSDPPSYHRRVPAENIQEPVSHTTKPVPEEPKTDLEQYKHETRVERVSYHQEVVSNPSQGDGNFGKRVGDVERQTAVPEVSSTTETDQRSYQFTNIHDQSFHHVQVTHHSPDAKLGAGDKAGRSYTSPERVYGVPEQNYEIDESVSVMSNGRAHGVQPPLTTESPKDSNKFGYVVEGRNFRKYRVEERTSDGFIVGEYGVVRHDDGSLRGVRYTADGTINPRVIYDALVKFLSL